MAKQDIVFTVGLNEDQIVAQLNRVETKLRDFSGRFTSAANFDKMTAAIRTHANAIVPAMGKAEASVRRFTHSIREQTVSFGNYRHATRAAFSAFASGAYVLESSSKESIRHVASLVRHTDMLLFSLSAIAPAANAAFTALSRKVSGTGTKAFGTSAAGGAVGAAGVGVARTALGAVGAALAPVGAALAPILAPLAAIAAGIIAITNVDRIARWIEGVDKATAAWGRQEKRLEAILEKNKKQSDVNAALTTQTMLILGLVRATDSIKNAEQKRLAINLEVAKLAADVKPDLGLTARLRTESAGGDPTKSAFAQFRNERESISAEIAKLQGTQKELLRGTGGLVSGAAGTAIREIQGQLGQLAELQAAKGANFVRQIQEINDAAVQVERDGANERIRIAENEAQQIANIRERETAERFRLGTATPFELFREGERLAENELGRQRMQDALRAMIPNLPGPLQDAARRALGVDQQQGRSGFQEASAFGLGFARDTSNVLPGRFRAPALAGGGGGAVVSRTPEAQLAVEQKILATLMRIERKKAGLN